MTETNAPRHPGYIQLIVALGFLTAVGPVAIDLYLPAFPRMAADLGVTVASVELTLSAFLLGLAGGQIVVGPLSDRWGRRPPLLVGFVLFTAGALTCVFARSVEALVCSRILMGAGGAAGQAVPRAMVRDLFSGRAVAKALTLTMLVVGVAPVLAPTVGGVVLRFFEWHALFWLQAGFGLLALAISAFALPESLPVGKRVGGNAAAVMRRYARVGLNPEFAAYTLLGMVTSGMLFAYVSGSPFVFIKLFMVSPAVFGILFGLNAVGLFSVAQLNHWLLRSLSSRQILLRAFLANLAATSALVICALSGSGGLWVFFGLTFVSLATIGLIFPNIAASALNLYPEQAGSASAIVGTAQYLGGALAGMLVASLADGTQLPLTAVMGSCSVIAVMTILWLRRRERPGRK